MQDHRARDRNGLRDGMGECVIRVPERCTVFFFRVVIVPELRGRQRMVDIVRLPGDIECRTRQARPQGEEDKKGHPTQEHRAHG